MFQDAIDACDQIRDIGYAVLPGILTQEEALWYRHSVLEHFENHSTLSKNCGKMERDPLRRAPFMKDILTHPRIIDVARTLIGPQFAYAHHADLQLNKISKWHKDNRGTNDYGTDENDKIYKIYKFLFYLQDHTEDDYALAVIPKSHRSRMMSILDPVRLHPALGDMIVFDQRLAHNGYTPPFLLRMFIRSIRSLDWRSRFWCALYRVMGFEDRVFIQVSFAEPGTFLDQHMASLQNLLLEFEGVRYTVSDDIRSYAEARGVYIPAIKSDIRESEPIRG